MKVLKDIMWLLSIIAIILSIVVGYVFYGWHGASLGFIVSIAHHMLNVIKDFDKLDEYDEYQEDAKL